MNRGTEDVIGVSTLRGFCREVELACNRCVVRPVRLSSGRRIAAIALLVLVTGLAPAVTLHESEAPLVAGGFARALWGETEETGSRACVDASGQPAAFLCQRRLADGRYATVLVNAASDGPSVLAHHCGLPSLSEVDDVLKMTARRSLAADEVRAGDLVYYSPFDIWQEFSSDGRSVMVSLRDLAVCDPARVRSVPPGPHPLGYPLLAGQWSGWASRPEVDDGQHWIDGVPDWDWHYGCAPTAAANVLTWYAARGYKLLLDSVRYNVPDPLEGDKDSVPNTSTQLAVAMSTDTLLTGSTASESIAIGIQAVCADPRWGNGYDFESYLCWNDRDLLIQEINAGRPGVLGLMGHPEYGNHAVTFCGWGPPDDGWVMVHDLWGGTPVDRVINLDYGGPYAVIPVIPTKSPTAELVVSAINRPADTLVPGPVRPQIQVENKGTATGTATAVFTVEHAQPVLDQGVDGTRCYEARQDVVVEPGKGLVVTFPAWEAGSGSYVASCSLAGSSSVLRRGFIVSAAVDRARFELGEPRVTSLHVRPNPCRRVMTLDGWTGPANVSVFNSCGALVMERPGHNSARVELPTLPAGVFMLRIDAAGREPASCRFTVTR